MQFTIGESWHRNHHALPGCAQLGWNWWQPDTGFLVIIALEKLGLATKTSPKSLMRMFGPRGNPQANNLFSVIGYLQKRAGLHLHISKN